MKNFCFTDKNIQAFLEKKRKGELSYSKLKTSSAERLNLFKSFLDEKSANEANILFEKSTLRKNKVEGYRDWVSKMTGVDSAKKANLKRKIEKNNEERLRRIFSPEEDEMFLESLVKERLGVGVTKEESAIIFKLSKQVEEGRQLFNRSTVGKKMKSIIGTLDEGTQKELDGFMDKILAETMRKTEIQTASRRLKRYLGKGVKVSDEQKKAVEALVDDIVKNRKKKIEYGIAKVELDEFIGEEKLKTLGMFKGKTLREKAKESLTMLKDEPINNGFKISGALIKEGFAIAKTSAATLDASFLGRQGRVALYNMLTRPSKGTRDVFLETAKANYGTLFKSLRKGEALKAVKQRIASRENSINGYYEKAGLDIGTQEEAFPSTFIEKAPGIGRAIKASNEAYTASAYTLRAMEFDRLIKFAQETGQEIDDDFLKSLGSYVNSVSGRGKGGIGRLGEKTNIALFSPKFLQSTLDTLTAHQFSEKATSFTRKEARKALAGIIAGTFTTLWIAKQMGADIEEDPRSSDFGKIRIGDRRFDVTGGLASVVTLFSRFGGIKSSTTGEMTELGDFGGKDLTGLVAQFFENKASPGLSAVLSVANNQNFDRQPVRDIMLEDPMKFGYIMTKDSFMPISWQEPFEKYIMGEAGSDEEWYMTAIGILADLNGISSNVYSFSTDFNYAQNKEAEKLREKYSEEQLKKLSDDFSKEVNYEILRLRDKEEFKNLSSAEKKKALNRKKTEIKKRVFREHGITVPKESQEEELQDRTFEAIYRNL